MMNVKATLGVIRCSRPIEPPRRIGRRRRSIDCKKGFCAATRCSSVFVRCGVDPRHLPDVQPPWALTFDLRERETIWTEQNKARLVQFIASDRLGIPREEMKKRIRELSILLPDMEILKSIDRVALTMIELKKAFPNTNVSVMLARNPSLLLQSVPSILAQAEQTKALLEIDVLDELIEQYPLFLDPTAVEEVLSDLQRLVPGNAKLHLVKNPSLLLSTVKGKKRLGEPADI